MKKHLAVWCRKFLLTCLLRGMTVTTLIYACKMWFLLTCLLRGMTKYTFRTSEWSKFLLTCLLRGMTGSAASGSVSWGFYSHASYEAWPGRRIRRLSISFVSTHMPLTRHDDPACAFMYISSRFYSHASYEAWRRMRIICIWERSFYSHASYEAWPGEKSIWKSVPSFYSHASYEAWRFCFQRYIFWKSFYSHASYEAWQYLPVLIKINKIVSTHMPLTRHNITYAKQYDAFQVSTHMPLTRHDF